MWTFCMYPGTRRTPGAQFRIYSSCPAYRKEVRTGYDFTIYFFFSVLCHIKYCFFLAWDSHLKSLEGKQFSHSRMKASDHTLTRGCKGYKRGDPSILGKWNSAVGYASLQTVAKYALLSDTSQTHPIPGKNAQSQGKNILSFTHKTQILYWLPINKKLKEQQYQFT